MSRVRIGVNKDLARAEQLYRAVLTEEYVAFRNCKEFRVSDFPIDLCCAYYSLSRLLFKQDRRDEFDNAVEYLNKAAIIISQRNSGMRGIAPAEDNEKEMMRGQMKKVHELKAKIYERQGNQKRLADTLKRIEQLRVPGALKTFVI